MTLRVKSATGGQMAIGCPGQPGFTFQVPVSTDWKEVSVPFSAAALSGVTDITVSLVGDGKVEVDWISWR